MAEQRFKIGDRVELISGGPAMTVTRYEPKDSEDVVCQWFDKNDNRKEKAFHQDTLQSSFDYGGVEHPIG